MQQNLCAIEGLCRLRRIKNGSFYKSRTARYAAAAAGAQVVQHRDLHTQIEQVLDQMCTDETRSASDARAVKAWG